MPLVENKLLPFMNNFLQLRLTAGLVLHLSLCRRQERKWEKTRSIWWSQAQGPQRGAWISVQALFSCWQHSHLAWLCPRESQNDRITVAWRPRCMSCRGRHAETLMTTDWQEDNTLKTHRQTHWKPDYTASGPADYFGWDSWLNFSFVYILFH